MMSQMLKDFFERNPDFYIEASDNTVTVRIDKSTPFKDFGSFLGGITEYGTIRFQKVSRTRYDLHISTPFGMIAFIIVRARSYDINYSNVWRVIPYMPNRPHTCYYSGSGYTNVGKWHSQTFTKLIYLPKGVSFDIAVNYSKVEVDIVPIMTEDEFLSAVDKAVEAVLPTLTTTATTTADTSSSTASADTTTDSSISTATSDTTADTSASTTTSDTATDSSSTTTTADTTADTSSSTA